jgi:hypothetical protein
MLAVAREEAERQDVKNIEFCAPAELFSRHQGFDFISCYLVFQRLAPHDGLSLLGTLIDGLAPEGIGVFHVPFKTAASPFVAGGTTTARWVRSTRLFLRNARTSFLIKEGHETAGQPHDRRARMRDSRDAGEPTGS